LNRNPREFINVVDYNFDHSLEHLTAVADLIGQSGARGWSCEMCIDSLAREDAVTALARNRCRIVYCGLESIKEGSLKAVNKTQNIRADYRKSVRSAQARGIDVAAGLIIGVPGYEPGDLSKFCELAEELGLIYLKFTFLTFNPGTKVHRSMLSRGRYATEDPARFDGTHLTFLPAGVDAAELLRETKACVRRFNSPLRIWRRLRHHRRFSARAEAFLYAYCFGQTYRQWLKHGILEDDEQAFSRLLVSPYSPGFIFRAAEFALRFLRRRQTAGGAAPAAKSLPEAAA
jgi:hypothetical protein